MTKNELIKDIAIIYKRLEFAMDTVQTLKREIESVMIMIEYIPDEAKEITDDVE